VARKRPIASNVTPPVPLVPPGPPDSGAPVDFGLTRSQAHAQRRCEPLTRAQFKAKGRRAEQWINPLPHE
jgi:hypothetical protein